MIQKPWCIVVWETLPGGPGAADRWARSGAAIFPNEAAAKAWLDARWASSSPSVRFTVTKLAYGDPEPYCGDPTAFDCAPDTVTIAEDLLCPIYFPS